MKISYNWLKEYVSDIPEPDRVAELLTGCGLEVESMESWASVKGGLDGVVIGEVLTCIKHPNSDHLSLTTVNIGSEKILKIVCGASNITSGQKVVIATIGTRLILNEKEVIIQRTKIRGELSEGMICAEDELGLGSSHSGIIVLDSSVIPGTLAKDYFKVAEDIVFEIGLTPNRSDATSHIGVARDLIAVLNCLPEHRNSIPVFLKSPDISDIKDIKSGQRISVEIEDTVACPRYSGLTFTGITVKESPSWLKNRLNSVGLRPINNIVDITNFILMEMGQPLHAFDADQIKGSKVIVKKYPGSKKFITLDEVEREITPQDLMISNEEEPMCIAGVFGGINSGVSHATKTVFLESAFFQPAHIRKTARYHGLQTDASFRYERGADVNITVFALRRAAFLIKEIAGGEVSSNIVDVYPNPDEPILVSLSFQHLDRLVGKILDREIINKILSSLGISVLSTSEEGLNLEIPSYKIEVTREADVIEEILRIYGYNNIEFSSTLHSSISFSPKPDVEKVKNGISDYLCANGFSEIMNNSLTRSIYYEDNTIYPISQNVRILNPLSKELDVMRQTMLYGGLETLAYNQNRKVYDCKLFEFGTCYFFKPDGGEKKPLGKYGEENHLAIFMTGRARKENWNVQNENVDIYDLKGFVNSIIDQTGIPVSFLETILDNSGIFVQGLKLCLKGVTLVRLGVLSPQLLRKFDLRQDVFYADFDWSFLLRNMIMVERSVKELAKFPEVRRDLALEVNCTISYAEIEKLAFATEKKLLKEVGLFDVYDGDKIEAGKKSYALYFILQDDQKTLTDEEIDKAMKRLIQVFCERINARIR